MSALHEAGRLAAEQVGIVYQVFPGDGRWYDTPAIGKDSRNGAGRIKLFSDGEGGLVHNWLTGECLPFFAGSEATLDPVSREARRQRIEAERQKAEEERQQRAAEAAKKAAALWKKGTTANDNGYLLRKGVQAVATLRQIGADEAAKIFGYTPKDLTGPLLVVPIVVDGRISSCQLIAEDGRKHFLAGGLLKGGYWATTGPLPEDDGEVTILIAEGAATALSCREATGHIALATMSCGNLPAVAAELRRRYPLARLVVCSDRGNGEHDARRAALEAGALLAIPEIDGEGSDFNDLHAAEGLEEVARQIEAASPVQSIPEVPPAEEKASQGEEGRRSPYQLATSTADLRMLDIKTEYLVDGLIPKGMITLFYAPSGMGKSTLANQLCQAVQDGTPFLGLSTIKTPVFYLDFENPLPTIVERLRKIGGDEPFPLWHHASEVAPPQIDRERDRQSLFELEPGTLLIIDTLKASNDADENTATDMKPVFDFLKALRRHGLTVVVLHHTSKGPDGTYRGSTVIQDQSDHCISMAKVKAPGSDQEADEDDDVQTYRFGTKGKTRAKPFRMYLTFDIEKELFSLAEDPAQEMMKRIRFAMECIVKRGEVVNQKRVIEELKDDGENELAKGKIIALLRRGIGTFWTIEKGLHNASLYTPISVFQFSSPIYAQKTGKLNFDDTNQCLETVHQGTTEDTQTSTNTEFASFPQFSTEGEKLTETVTAGDAPDLDW